MKVYEVRLSVLQELMLACKTNVNMASSVTWEAPRHSL
jgi:hypothetical protein